MVQPKTPPLSIRPGEERLAKIDAWATDHGLSRHAAILALLDLAMDQRAQAVMKAVRLTPEQPRVSGNTAATPVAGSLQLGPTRPKPGERQKGAKK